MLYNNKLRSFKFTGTVLCDLLYVYFPLGGVELGEAIKVLVYAYVAAGIAEPDFVSVVVGKTNQGVWGVRREFDKSGLCSFVVRGGTHRSLAGIDLNFIARKLRQKRAVQFVHRSFKRDSRDPENGPFCPWSPFFLWRLWGWFLRTEKVRPRSCHME